MKGKINSRLKEARDFADSLAREQRHLEPLSVFPVLEQLANAGDETRFRIVVDNYVSQMRRDRDEYKLKSKVDDPYAYIEWLCMGADRGNDFTEIGRAIWDFQDGNRIKILPVLRTQEFFQRLYGGHFYLGDKVKQN